MTVTLKDKSQLRREVLSRRDGIPPQVRTVKDREIMQRLITYRAFKEAEVLMLFASFRSEINTFPIIEHALKEGKGVVLPRVNREEKVLDLFYIGSLDELVEGYMGIKEPDPERCRPATVDSLDLVVLPGVAFDEKGGRLGYGGGYYDRLLASLRDNPILVGLAYEEQVVDEIPLEEHDRRVQIIITDKRVIEV
ncbi:MAG TPA: 5-formyltetrahydrofolate cyclo-ligase [Nitrospirae bacterium]|nr:5-formyltetrahydrofolate cyclo-ligase [Nitrospirota bacterium]